MLWSKRCQIRLIKSVHTGNVVTTSHSSTILWRNVSREQCQTSAQRCRQPRVDKFSRFDREHFVNNRCQAGAYTHHSTSCFPHLFTSRCCSLAHKSRPTSFVAARENRSSHRPSYLFWEHPDCFCFSAKKPVSTGKDK